MNTDVKVFQFDKLEVLQKQVFEVLDVSESTRKDYNADFGDTRPPISVIPVHFTVFPFL